MASAAVNAVLEHVLQRRHSGPPLTAAEKAEDLVDPYEKATNYTHVTVAVIAGIILLFGLARHIGSYRAGSKRTTARKPVAGLRYLSSRQQRMFGFTFPVLGTGLLMLAFFLFMFVWTWGTRPYYRSKWYVGSPPLAIRTGMMALGCFPFIFAFASKVNAVTFVTGVSHEKLQVYHQWMSHLFLFLSWVHTIPFLIQGLSEWKPGYEPPIKQLNYSMLVAKKVYYWTGCVLLFLLSVLCWGSFSFIRKRYYEAFKWIHIISGWLFIPFFFLHCNKLLGSWDYLIATAVLYCTAIVGRLIIIFMNNATGMPRASFEVLGGGMVKLVIRTNPLLRWRPGQHYFINFPTCQPLQSHPFTIANIPRPSQDNDKEQELVLLIRSASGLTQKLRKHLETRANKKSIPCLLDGPYGGLDRDMTVYDSVLLIAGGTGITFVKPILEDIIQKTHWEEGLPCKTVNLVWSVRTDECIVWMETELQTLKRLAGHLSLTVNVHVTRQSADLLKIDSEEAITPSDISEKPAKPCCCSKKSKPLVPVYGRANVQSLVRDAALADKSLGIVVCGPDEMVFEARNTVADIQKDIVTGRASVRDIFLHSEEYSW